MAKVTIEISDDDWNTVSDVYGAMTESTNDALDCLKHTIECVFGNQSVISMHLEPRSKLCGTDTGTITDLCTLERRRMGVRC